MRRCLLLCVLCLFFAAALAETATANAAVLIGDQTVESTVDTNSPGSAEAFPFSNATAGTAASISVYVDFHNTARTLVAGLYSASNGHPGTLLASGSLAPKAGAWNTVSIASTAVSAGGTYWVAVLGERGTVYFRDRSGGPCYSVSSYQTSLTSLPSSWTSSVQWNTCPISAYVNGTGTATAAPVNAASPTISGTATQGQTLSTSNGMWSNSPSAYAYQWQDCDSSGASCANVSGATSSSYTLMGGDVKHTVRAMVKASNAGGSTSAASAQTAMVSPLPAAPVNTALPAVTGTAIEGQSLSLSNGAWSGSPTAYGYQWQDCDSSGANCTDVSGATSSSYTLTSGDVNDTMRVIVTATNADGSTSATSAQTAVVAAAVTLPPSNTGLPVVSGSTVQGQAVSTSNGTWSGSPTGYTYGWQRCDSSGNNCTAIGGGSSSTYTLQSGDAGQTIRAVVTATNQGGSAAATSAQTTTVTASGGGGGSLPPGVTLQQVDGGPNYYCSRGFTNACNGGWDNASFFPVGNWYGYMTSQSEANTYKDLGWNTAFRTISSDAMSLFRSNGLFAIVDDEDSSGPETPGMGSETVGLLSSDEPSTMAGGVTTPLGTVPNSQQDGRFWYLNNTWNFIHYQGIPSGANTSAYVLSNQVTTPSGAKRHIDTQSVDTYWFSGTNTQYSINYEGQLMYGLGSQMTNAQAWCGCRYGDMIRPVFGTNVGMSDAGLASFQTANPAPVYQFVETGDPYNDPGSRYITPPEINWATWSSIVHGARGIIYFDTTFHGNGICDSCLNQANSYYTTIQPGQTISVYNQVKGTDALIRQEAPAINAPTALGYVTVSPAPTTFGGIEARATDNNGTFTIFADTRDAETQGNIGATFTTADGYTGPVTVVGESRTIQATNGVFTDTFANGSTVHIYQIH